MNPKEKVSRGLLSTLRLGVTRLILSTSHIIYIATYAHDNTYAYEFEFRNDVILFFAGIIFGVLLEGK